MPVAMRTVTSDGIERKELGSREVLVVEASTLGLEPGVWPETLKVLRKVRILQDADLYTRPCPMMVDGKFTGMRYKGRFGAVLEVLND